MRLPFVGTALLSMQLPPSFLRGAEGGRCNLNCSNSLLTSCALQKFTPPCRKGGNLLRSATRPENYFGLFGCWNSSVTASRLRIPPRTFICPVSQPLPERLSDSGGLLFSPTRSRQVYRKGWTRAVKFCGTVSRSPAVIEEAPSENPD